MATTSDRWYESMGDVVSTLNALDDDTTVLPRTTLNPDREGFAGATWDEALRLAQFGWTVDRDLIDSEVERTLENLSDRLNAHLDSTFREVHDVSGGYVDVARYLDGEPECMVEQWVEPAPKRGKVIRVLNNCVAPSFVDEGVLRERGRSVAIAVEVLHRLGFNLELWVGESVQAGRDYVIEMVKVKDAADLMDWDSIMFAMAHPAMLRCIAFGLNETRPDDERDKFGFVAGRGYGTCCEFPSSITEQFDVVLESQKSNHFNQAAFIENILVTAESDRIEEFEV